MRKRVARVARYVWIVALPAFLIGCSRDERPTTPAEQSLKELPLPGAAVMIGAGDIEERHGLDMVASRYLSESVDKTERLSNWNFELSEAQLQYAARDAAVLVPLREKLIERLRSDSLIQCAQLEPELARGDA